MSNNVKNKVIIRTDRKQATQILAYIVSALSLVMCGMVCAGSYFLYQKEFVSVGICVAVLVGCGVFLAYANTAYTWVIGGILERRCGHLVYEYSEIVDLLGRSKCTYTMKDIKKVVVGKRYTKVYGKSSFKGFIGKTKDVKKFTIYDCSQEAVQFLKDNLSSSVVFKES